MVIDRNGKNSYFTRMTAVLSEKGQITIPKPVLIIPLIVKSEALVPSSATVKVLVAPIAIGAEIVAPFVPVPASVVEIGPASVIKPEPIIAVALVDPHPREILVGLSKVYEDKSNVEPAVIVNPAEIAVFSMSVTVFSGLSILRLALVVDARPVPVI